MLPRRGGIARAAADGRSEPQVLAANVDVALVVGSLNRDFNLRRLERFLTLAADAEAEPVVVLSKADLDPEPALRATEVRAALGGTVPVIAVSVVDGTGLDALGAWLAPGRTAVLLGSSGVGKTSLLNRLSGEARPTLPVREGDDRGRHATTHRELVPLAGGALVIDTPGLRLPRLWEQAAGLRTVFADVESAGGALPVPRLLAPGRAGLRGRRRDRRRAPPRGPARRHGEARPRGGVDGHAPRRARARGAQGRVEADPQGPAPPLPRARPLTRDHRPVT